LGVRLPVRSPRRRSPTEAGIAFDERALRAITLGALPDAALVARKLTQGERFVAARNEVLRTLSEGDV